MPGNDAANALDHANLLCRRSNSSTISPSGPPRACLLHNNQASARIAGTKDREGNHATSGRSAKRRFGSNGTGGSRRSVGQGASRQESGVRRLGAAQRRRGGDRAQCQQRLHHGGDLPQRGAGRRRDRRREIRHRAEAVRRRQRSGARHHPDPAPDRRGHRLLPGLVRQQHRVAHRGDHRTGEEADGADRRRFRRDFHPWLQVRVRHVSPRHAPVRRQRGPVQDPAAHAADLFGDLHQRRLLQDRGRGCAAVVRRGGLQAARQLRAAGQADRRFERARLGARQHARSSDLRHA